MAGIQVRSLPSITVTTTVSSAIGALDDAATLCIALDTTSTGTHTVEVELTDTGTAFLPLFVTSTGTALTLVANGVTTITEIAFRQLRIVESSVPSETLTFKVAKQIWV